MTVWSYWFWSMDPWYGAKSTKNHPITKILYKSRSLNISDFYRVHGTDVVVLSESDRPTISDRCLRSVQVLHGPMNPDLSKCNVSSKSDFLESLTFFN